MSPFRTRSCRRRRPRSIKRWRRIFAPALSGSPGFPPGVIVADRGSRSRDMRSVDLADPVAAEIEGGEAGFEIGGQHRHLDQLVDRILAVGIACRLERLIPFACVISP